MSYIDGFVIAVPTANKEAYREMSRRVSVMFKEIGALQVVECWGDDVPAGKVTDFAGAVKATADETVVFAWVWWPSKEARDEGNEKMRTDPRMQTPADIPFDGARMIFGGFDVIFDSNEP